MWVKKYRHNKKYTYGTIHRVEDGVKKENVRMINKTGKVEFILWKKGEQNHDEDYWHEMGYGWENNFIPNT